MSLTRAFKDTVKVRADKDPAFRKALISEALNSFVEGDILTMKTLLRDYINATDGFETVADAIGKSPKGLMRSLGPKGNPQVDTLAPLMAYAIKREGIGGFTIAPG
ncbi:transcriptional regulator [Azospirillum sp. SYSU D00513]|uniref:helix-turn-helix domain-containing transcriptional regulator n=1 Tax=Azospirillum sp. SYSU D00513 TaxID=2812561 RepID=UPI001A969BD1|nr:transcriptional regulator [Azospirillum sp. SYSU D00513]